MRLFLVCALLLGTVSCVRNTAWRLPPSTKDWSNCQAAQQYSVLHEGGAAAAVATHADLGKKGYTLGFVEFDDFGEFFSRCQLSNALAAIDAAKAAAIPDADGKKTIVAIVFVHGWKNNASDKTGNVWGFRDSLKDIVANVAPPGSPVVGIYIGWRGAVIDAPVLKEFTFYDRRDTATHVSGAQVTETLVSVMRQVKGADFSGDSRCVLVGHSFGGYLLEHAITQSLVNMVLPAKELNSPADLIVFVNEAGPALEAKPTLEFLHSHNVQLTSKLPLIVSVTSKGDTATKFLLPAAQYLSRPRNNLRTYPDPDANFGVSSQASLYVQSTANDGALQTHLIGRASDADIQAGCVAGREYTHFNIDDTSYRVVGLDKPKNDTAYWVMQMPIEIVPDHSTIFRPQFRELLKAMLVPTPIKDPAHDCQPSAPPESREMTPSLPQKKLRLER